MQNRLGHGLAATLTGTVLLLVSLAGGQTWVSTYDYEENEACDRAVAAAADNLGNVYILGTCEDDGGHNDVVLVRMSPEGVVSDPWVYDGDSTAEAVDLALDVEHGRAFVLAAVCGEYRIAQFSTDTPGTPNWAYALGGCPDEYLADIDLLADSAGVLGVVAVTTCEHPSDPDREEDMYVVALGHATTAETLWTRYFDWGVTSEDVSHYDIAEAVLVDRHSGRVYLSGKSIVGERPDEEDDLRPVVVSYESDGSDEQKEDNDHDDDYDDYAPELLTARVMALGSRLYLSVAYVDDMGDSLEENDNFQTRVFSLNPDGLGMSPRTKRLDNPGVHEVPAVALVDRFGNLALAAQGTDTTEDEAGTALLMSRFSAGLHGVLSQDSAYLGSVDPVEQPPEEIPPGQVRGIAEDADGNVFVTATSYELDPEGGDILTMMYAAQGYRQAMWLYQGNDSLADDAVAVCACQDDSTSWIVVVGTSESDDSELDFVALRYDPSAPLGCWVEQESMPKLPSGKAVKRGGWLAADDNLGVVYAAKGYKEGDFYRYDPSGDTWSSLRDIPGGAEGKMPEKGCRGVCDGNGHVYMTKGNTTFGFWSYDIAANTWTALADVPAGPTGKKVKGGTDLAYVEVNDTGYVYMLKGYKCEFWRFNPAAGPTGVWEARASAPIGIKEKWDRGSWIVYDGENTIYAHKAKYYDRSAEPPQHELWAYDIGANTWGAVPLSGMPLPGPHGGAVKNKKAKDGGAGVWLNDGICALKGGNTQMFYRYEATGDSWTDLDTIPRQGASGKKSRVKQGGDLVYLDGSLYALKGNKTTQLWRYGPGATTLFAGRSYPPRGRSLAGGGTDNIEDAVAEGYDAFRPRWSPNGQYVCYYREDDDGVEQVYVSDAAGQNEWQQTFGEGSCENPVWSPNVNEKVIAFQSEDTATGFWQIAVVEFDTSGQDAAPTVAPVEPLPVSAPVALSPVSQALPKTVTPVLAKRIQGPKTIAARPAVAAPSSPGLDADPLVLTSDDFDHENPDWSPDAKFVLYQKDDETGYTQLYRIPAGGGDEQQLTWDRADHEDPKYLDDTHVVYTYSAYGEYDQVYVLNLTTMTQSPLTESDYDHGQPNPQPGGASVVFEVEDDYGMTQIGWVSDSGGDEEYLTEEEIDLETPVWSSDSASVFCVGWRYPGTEIARVPVQTGGYEAVTDSEVIRLHPDVHYHTLSAVSANYVVYERETADANELDGNRGRCRRPGRGIFLIRVKRHPGDGVQTGESFKLALERIRPNPAAGQLSLRWQVPGRDRVRCRRST